MSRARWISLGALAVVLALLPFVPRGGGDGGALRTAGRHSERGHHTALTAGYGRVTPADRRVIDRVVSRDLSSPRLSPTMPARSLVQSLVRCATFEGQRYCLGSGWTDQTQSGLRARMGVVASRQAAAREAARRAAARTSLPAPVTSTGELSLLDALRQEARLSPSALAARQRAELVEAARAVAKVWLIRHQIQGVPLPPHFLARHPEVRAESTPIARDPGRQPLAKGSTAPTSAATSGTTTAPTTAPTSAPTTGTTTPSGPTLTGTATTSPSPSPMMVKHWRDYPSKGVVLHRKDVAEQIRTYWCGPASMQMIAWGWKGKDLGQAYWADKLGTTTSGTSTAQMVHTVNRYTGYDKKSYAGPYIVLDVGNWTFRQWMLLMARHIVDYRAPVILNPLLHTEYYPYLDHDGSGHFQVGRGYKKRGDKTPLLGYFEPWNQQSFHPDEPYIGRVQWRNAYRSYRADLANFGQDVGV
jgi:hypothetical protein